MSFSTSRGKFNSSNRGGGLTGDSLANRDVGGQSRAGGIYGPGANVGEFSASRRAPGGFGNAGSGTRGGFNQSSNFSTSRGNRSGGGFGPAPRGPAKIITEAEIVDANADWDVPSVKMQIVKRASQPSVTEEQDSQASKIRKSDSSTNEKKSKDRHKKKSDSSPNEKPKADKSKEIQLELQQKIPEEIHEVLTKDIQPEGHSASEAIPKKSQDNVPTEIQKQPLMPEPVMDKYQVLPVSPPRLTYSERSRIGSESKQESNVSEAVPVQSQKESIKPSTPITSILANGHAMNFTSADFSRLACIADLFSRAFKELCEFAISKSQ